MADLVVPVKLIQARVFAVRAPALVLVRGGLAQGKAPAASVVHDVDMRRGHAAANVCALGLAPARLERVLKTRGAHWIGCTTGISWVHKGVHTEDVSYQGWHVWELVCI